jgi:hypothetical protein
MVIACPGTAGSIWPLSYPLLARVMALISLKFKKKGGSLPGRP